MHFADNSLPAYLRLVYIQPFFWPGKLALYKQTMGCCDGDITKSAKWVHFLCGVFHVVSASTILAVGLHGDRQYSDYAYNVSKNKGMHGSVWKFQCYNNNTMSYDPGYAACDDDDRQFVIFTDNPFGHTFNLLAAAVAYAYWSGLIHLFRWALMKEYNQRKEQFWRLCLDYFGSAPVMLAVINALWGANTLWGMLVAPLLLGLLLWASYGLIISRKSSKTKNIAFATLICLYIGCLTPTFYATGKAISSDGKAADEGTAPAFIAAFVAVFMLVFSSFIYPYYLELKSEKTDCFIEFSVLSLVSKVTLHAFLGVAVLQQTSMTGDDKIVDETPPDAQTPAAMAFQIASGTVLVGTVLAVAMAKGWGKEFKGPLYQTFFADGSPPFHFERFLSMGVLCTSCVMSLLSVTSIASFASVLSIGSAFSVSSIGSVGSVHSVGCVGGFFQDCTQDEPSGSLLHLPIAIVYNVLVVIVLCRLVRAAQTVMEDNTQVKVIIIGVSVVAVWVAFDILLHTSMMANIGILLILAAVALHAKVDKLAPIGVSCISVATGLTLIIMAEIANPNTATRNKMALLIVLGITIASLGVAAVAVACLANSSAFKLMQQEKSTISAASRIMSVLTGVVIFAAIIGTAAWTMYGKYSAPTIGTYTIGPDETGYGAGPQRRYIVFDFSEPVCTYESTDDDADAVVSGSGSGAAPCIPQPNMQNWTTLHRTDKYNVRMRVEGLDALTVNSKLFDNNDLVVPDVGGQMYTVGVEQKGKDRDVPNLSIEFRDPTNDLDDMDVEPYKHFNNRKYADWWITFGAAGDTTHARQMFANEFNNVPSVVVDVLTKSSDGVMTYEGVALMLPAFKKDLYNDLNAGVYGETKYKCENGALEYHTGSFLMEYNDGNTKKKKVPANLLNRDFPEDEPAWKNIYPKSSKVTVADCGDEGYKQLQDINNTVVKLLNTKGFDNVDQMRFVLSYVWELILMDTDFPFRSSKYAFNSNTRTLLPGFLWDYNSPSYRVLHTDIPFQLRNIYPTYGWHDPLPFWEHVCEQQAKLFGDTWHGLEIAMMLNDAAQAIAEINSTFLTPEYMATYKRSQSRNNDYGTFVGTGLDLTLHSIHDMTTKPSYQAEMEYQLRRLKERIQYIKTHMDADCKATDTHYADYIIAMISIVPIVMVMYLILSCFVQLGSTATTGYFAMSNFEDIELTLW